MERMRVLTILRAHQSELQAAGISHLRLFGSVARGSHTSTSDVDLLADFSENASVSLLGLCHLQNRIADLLGTEVDLIASRSLRDFARENVASESVLAF